MWELDPLHAFHGRSCLLAENFQETSDLVVIGDFAKEGLLGYVRRSERKTGKVRKKRQSPPNLEVL